MNELEAAIEGLYEVFARHPKPAKIVSCPCGCTKPEETSPLLASPLRQIAARDLQNYAFSAMTTQGNVEDFRYLLPRLFEAMTIDLNGVSAETVFGKLAYGRWWTWPGDEIAAIQHYLRAIWMAALSSYPIEERLPTFFEIETLLCCIACTGESLEPYFEVWTQTQTVQADEILVQFATWHGADFSNGRTLAVAWWEKLGAQGKELRSWLLRPDTMKRLEGAAHLVREDGYEHFFASALEVLRREALAANGRHR